MRFFRFDFCFFVFVENLSIVADATAGQTFVEKNPEFFINGKTLHSLKIEEINQLEKKLKPGKNIMKKSFFF